MGNYSSRFGRMGNSSSRFERMDSYSSRFGQLGGGDTDSSCVSTGSSPLLLGLGEAHDPDFQWNIYGFSALLERSAIPATSDYFHSCGYKWCLHVSPSNIESGTTIPYLALSLSLQRLHRSEFNQDHIVSAVFELSMYNYSNGRYCGSEASYNFCSKKNYSDKICLVLQSSDFLVDDSCVFGARILKVNAASPEKPITTQNLFLQKKEFIKGTYTWSLDNFLDLKHSVRSPRFDVGGHKWYIKIYPLGDRCSIDSVSLYLRTHIPDTYPGVMVEVEVSILDQDLESGHHHHSSYGRQVISQNFCMGWPDFIPLKTLKDPSRCYLVGSKCVVKADITIIGSSYRG